MVCEIINLKNQKNIDVSFILYRHVLMWMFQLKDDVSLCVPRLKWNVHVYIGFFKEVLHIVSHLHLKLSYSTFIKENLSFFAPLLLLLTYVHKVHLGISGSLQLQIIWYMYFRFVLGLISNEPVRPSARICNCNSYNYRNDHCFLEVAAGS